VAQTLQGVIACANHPQKDLSSRQHAFLKAYAKGKTLKQAAIEAGYSKKNADQSGYQMLKAIKGSMVNENKKTIGGMSTVMSGERRRPIVTSHPSFGLGFDSHRPLHKFG
jgi:hypothetical protein